MEKFTIFIGWRVNVCSNQVLTGEGVSLSLEVMSVHDLYKGVLELFNHSSVAITKRYLGLRQEEILETYDVLSF